MTPQTTFLCSSRMYKSTIQEMKRAATPSITNIRQCVMNSVARAENIVPMMKIPMIATIPINTRKPCATPVEPSQSPARNHNGLFPLDVECDLFATKGRCSIDDDSVPW